MNYQNIFEGLRSGGELVIPEGDFTNSKAHDYFLDRVKGADAAEKELEERGLPWIVIRSDPQTLQIDIDSEEAYDTFKRIFGLIQQYIEFTLVVVKKSKTSGHKHITLRMGKTMPAYERILLQSVLGSDPMREALNYLDITMGIKDPIFFYEKGEIK